MICILAMEMIRKDKSYRELDWRLMVERIVDCDDEVELWTDEEEVFMDFSMLRTLMILLYPNYCIGR